MKKLFLLVLLTAGTLNLQAQDKEPAKIDGTWTLTMSTPRGERSGEIVITQDGAEATAETEDGQEFEISIDGNEVSFVQTIDSPMGEIELKFVGTVSDGEMEGTVTMESGPMSDQEMEWTAIKEEEDSPKQ